MTDRKAALVWGEVKEAIVERWIAAWGETSPTRLANEKFDPPDGEWVDLKIQRRPGGPGTIGRPGNRKMDRAGSVFLILHTRPGEGDGDLTDRADRACRVFESCRFGPHGLRFTTAEPLGDAAEIEGGRWYGVTVEARFDYDETI